MSNEQREALKIAASVNDHIHEHSSWCAFCKKIAAALLEAQADGISEGFQEEDFAKAQNLYQRLRAEAQQLRSGK